MSEAEWMACEDPEALFHSLSHSWSERKCILFLLAADWEKPPTADPGSRYQEAERYADGQIELSELRRRWGTSSGKSWVEDAVRWADFFAAMNPAASKATIIRDIFGNPFRPVALDPAWLTPTVVALASQLYESRDFGAMPILADALQDADCDNDAILDHCRGPGPHVPGCWVVDLVLGKM